LKKNTKEGHQMFTGHKRYEERKHYLVRSVRTGVNDVRFRINGIFSSGFRKSKINYLKKTMKADENNLLIEDSVKLIGLKADIV
jgi:hypothetical protein